MDPRVRKGIEHAENMPQFLTDDRAGMVAREVAENGGKIQAQ